MAGISTHVLDNYTGRPGAGMRIDFSKRQADGSWKLVKTMVTNNDGRTDGPVLAPADAMVGEYKLSFYVADFYAPKPEPSATRSSSTAPCRCASRSSTPSSTTTCRCCARRGAARPIAARELLTGPRPGRPAGSSP